MKILQSHLLFFDIDGTLVDEETGVLTQETKRALNNARKNGHLVFLNTGRSYSELDPAVVAVGFDGFVCGCGTHVKVHDETLVKCTVEGEEAKQIVALLEACKIEALLEGEEAFYLSKESKDARLFAVLECFGPEVNKKRRYWQEDNVSFQKFTIWFGEDGKFEQLQNALGDRFSFLKRDKGFYEVMPKGYSKASGMECLMQHYHISKKYTMAIGDSTNDLSMLTCAGISVAMGNSKEIVKKQVQFVTKHVKEEGVAYALTHFGFVVE